MTTENPEAEVDLPGVTEGESQTTDSEGVYWPDSKSQEQWWESAASGSGTCSVEYIGKYDWE